MIAFVMALGENVSAWIDLFYVNGINRQLWASSQTVLGDVTTGAAKVAAGTSVTPTGIGALRNGASLCRKAGTAGCYL